MKPNRISGAPIKLIASLPATLEQHPWYVDRPSGRGGLQRDFCYEGDSKEFEHALYDVVYETSSPQEAAARIDQNLRIGELERSVLTLQRQVRALEQQLSALSGEHQPQSLSTAVTADPRLSDVVVITEEMFGTPEINVLFDPEDAGTPIVVLTVKCGGNAKELVDKRIEWHDRVNAIPPGSSGRLRLSIVPLR